LRQARDRRDAARKVIERGDDPGELKRAEKAQAAHEASNTFEAVARDWLKHQRSMWAPSTKVRIQSALESDVFPKIGARPMAQIKPREAAAAVKAIEDRGAGEMAGRVLQTIRANPMVDLKPGELLKPRQVTHRPALTDKQLPAFLCKLADYQGEPTTAHALRLLMLTAVRPGEVRGARWSEIDAQGAEWRIPAERMKMRAEHVVPLSRQSLEVLAAMRPLSGERDLVFPSPYYPGKSLSENTLNSALARLGYKGIATAHGMRSLFSTVANERGHDPDVIERQLAHIERNAVRAAYHRSTYMRERATLMQWWADYLDGRGGKVVALGAKEVA
jgi:integrase